MLLIQREIPEQQHLAPSLRVAPMIRCCVPTGDSPRTSAPSPARAFREVGIHRGKGVVHRPLGRYVAAIAMPRHSRDIAARRAVAEDLEWRLRLIQLDPIEDERSGIRLARAAGRGTCRSGGPARGLEPHPG